MGGTFTNYATATGRSRLIRLNTDGTTDTAFCLNTDNKVSSTIQSIQLAADNKVYLCEILLTITQDLIIVFL